MIGRILRHLRGQAIAYTALFIALGGTGYAAVNLPAGSVGNRQLKNHSVTPIKLDRSAIAGYVRDWAKIDDQGQIVASRPRAHLVFWNEQNGSASGGLVSWSQPIPTACFALANAESVGGPALAYATAAIYSAGSKNGPDVGADIHLSQPQQAVDVAVICPQS